MDGIGLIVSELEQLTRYWADPGNQLFMFDQQHRKEEDDDQQESGCESR